MKFTTQDNLASLMKEVFKNSIAEAINDLEIVITQDPSTQELKIVSRIKKGS